jgi:hypothetical protein
LLKTSARPQVAFSIQMSHHPCGRRGSVVQQKPGNWSTKMMGWTVEPNFKHQKNMVEPPSWGCNYRYLGQLVNLELILARSPCLWVAAEPVDVFQLSTDFFADLRGFRPATCRSSHDCASQCSAGPFLAPGRKQRWKSLVWWSKFNKINRIFDGSWNKPVILFLTIQVICNLMTEAIFSGSGCSISTPQSGKTDIGATYRLHLFF